MSVVALQTTAHYPLYPSVGCDTQQAIVDSTQFSDYFSRIFGSAVSTEFLLKKSRQFGGLFYTLRRYASSHWRIVAGCDPCWWRQRRRFDGSIYNHFIPNRKVNQFANTVKSLALILLGVVARGKCILLGEVNVKEFQAISFFALPLYGQYRSDQANPSGRNRSE